MITRKITIVLRGETEADVEDAFEGAIEGLKNGCVEGHDKNASSGFYFYNSGNVTPAEIPA